MYNTSKILYIGGYENATTADILYERYKSKIIIIEPVEIFYRQLIWNKKILEKDSEKKSKFEIIHKGVGKADQKLWLHENNILADGTSFVKQNLNECEETSCMEIEIREVGKFLKELSLNGLNDITLLHMNCEGCEFDVLESLISQNLLVNFPSIKFDVHYADFLESDINPKLLDRYCRIRYELSKMFKLVSGVPFLKERWDRHDLYIYFDIAIYLPTEGDLFFKVGVNWNNKSSKLEYDDNIINQVKPFCDNNQLDDHICFQIWEYTLKRIKEFDNHSIGIWFGMKQASAILGILMPNGVQMWLITNLMYGTFGIKEKVTTVSFHHILDDGSIRTETLSVSRDSIPIQLSSEYGSGKKLGAIAFIDVYDQINAQHRKLEDGCWTKNGWWLKINNTMAW